MTDLGQKIRKARRLAGYSNAEQLAVPLGVGVRTVQRWEQGKSVPSVAQLLQIASLTEQPLSYFVIDGAEAVA